MPENSRIIMHIDANSAFLSWSAAEALRNGAELDYRTVPAVIGGDEESRHGIVLAKSVPAKAYGIRTAMTLAEARRSCPNLLVIPADHELYSRCSRAMFSMLAEYSPVIQKFSIDEGFIDYTGMEPVHGEPVKTAYEIKERIKSELGFTVNVGVSCNKLLAKMAGELKKPDMVHTLWPDEIKTKMHPLPVGELFMVGKSSEAALRRIGIKTIGDLAKMDRGLVKTLLKSHGDLIWRYANGIDDSPVEDQSGRLAKGVGNSITISYDVTDRADAEHFLLKIAEQVGMRLRKKGARGMVVCVTIKTDALLEYSRQEKLDNYTDSTDVIYRAACRIFGELWRKEPIRMLNIRVTELDYTGEEQMTLFGAEKTENDRKFDNLVDELRQRFGSDTVFRGSLAEKSERLS